LTRLLRLQIRQEENERSGLIILEALYGDIVRDGDGNICFASPRKKKNSNVMLRA
jgi:hypothetical protein